MVTGRAGVAARASVPANSCARSRRRHPASRAVAVRAPPRRRASRLAALRGSARPRRAAAASPTARCAAAAARPARSRRSSDSARCAPRLVGTSAWISSTITVSTAAERLARVRGQQQVQRLRRRDQDVGRLARRSGRARWPACRRCGRDRWARGTASPAARRGLRDAGERRAQVALDVDGQRLERRDVEDAAAALRRRLRLEHQPVEAPQERGQRLAAAGRRQEQRRFPARDGGPALGLGRRRAAGEGGLEPVPHSWMKRRKPHRRILQRQARSGRQLPRRPR